MGHYNYDFNLRSRRIVTRKLTPNDIEPWISFLEDEDSNRYIPKFDTDVRSEQSRIWIERQISRYTNNNYGLQALIEKESGDFIGQCGIILQEVEGKTELEIGYHIFKKYWGKGYAPEAAKLFIDFAFNNRLCSSLISIIKAGNTKSERVAEKNGFIREKRIAWNGNDVHIYRLNAPTL